MATTRQKLQPNRELYALRLNAGFTRATLAARTGVSIESIRKAERGHTPGSEIQGALAKEFDKEPLQIWPMERQRTLRSLA